MWEKPKFLEELSDIARMKVDAEPLGDDALEVEPPPAHDPVLLTIRTRLDDLRELSQLLRRKTRLGTLRPVGLCHVAVRGVAKIRASRNSQTAATAVRHVSIATARSARCVWAEVR